MLALYQTFEVGMIFSLESSECICRCYRSCMRCAPAGHSYRFAQAGKVSGGYHRVSESPRLPENWWGGSLGGMLLRSGLLLSNQKLSIRALLLKLCDTIFNFHQ